LPRLVSTIVLNYNGRHLLGECLEAVLRQTYPNQEVIVVDNASTDGSQALVQEKFPSVRLLPLRQNLATTGGYNRGIAIARGEFIALLNNDAIPEPHWLEELCKVMDEDPSIGTCASRMLFHGTSMINEIGMSWTVWGHARAIDMAEPSQGKHLQGREVFGACSGAALYRRSMLDEIKGFDEEFFVGADDVDLSFRAQLADYRCVYVPTAVVYHYCGATLNKNLGLRAFYSIRNMEYVFIKNMPGPLARKYLFRHLAYFAALNIIGVPKRRVMPTLRADWQIFRGLPKLLKKRKQIQSKRKTSLERLESFFQQETCLELVRAQLNRWCRR